ncbi:MAG: ATP-dependent protease LonB [Clostridia bacterium]|nr:ATP-dependent protease LonB [Clostridia bacterium]
MLNTIMSVIQIWLLCVMGIYFYSMLRAQNANKSSINKDSLTELNKLKKLQKISLTKPLSEVTRPSELEEIVGQKDGIKALKAALCGKNPQHVIIYGPPGVGKTAAARTVLNEAKKNPISPFSDDSKFVEIDATTLRFDDRSIADPLMGSVHDPIYQGAGAFGPAGIPQPKPGAVTKAHGGILFIDEIGELHPIQMNKLLKVLEDRKVFFESAYYSKSNREIPVYIHEIFQKGMPADFRLVAATTSLPEELPPALRSRCTEIFFNPLSKEEIIRIGENAAKKGNFKISDSAIKLISKFCDNGREAVNLIQTAGSYANIEKRDNITKEDIEWVAECSRFTAMSEQKVSTEEFIGKVNGLAVTGASKGTLMTIEAKAHETEKGRGSVKITGIVETETLERRGQKLNRESTIKASVENVLTLLSERYNTNPKNYNIHINFPGGMPVDGPSAGVAIFIALYSAIHNIPIKNDIAFTGEISIFGNILPVGGVKEKIEAAKNAGAEKVYIPKENDRNYLHKIGTNVVSVSNISEVTDVVFKNLIKEEKSAFIKNPDAVLTAEGIN